MLSVCGAQSGTKLIALKYLMGACQIQLAWSDKAQCQRAVSGIGGHWSFIPFDSL